MRCDAFVRPEALEIRSSEDLTRRCQRNGKRKLGSQRFCYQHLPEELKVHDRIVARIRAIPIRPDVDILPFRMSTVAEWPSYVFHKPDGLPVTLRNHISAEAREQDQSLADTIRGILCSHYRLDCPPRSKMGYQSDRDQGATKMVIRLQPELFQAIKEDSTERHLTIRLVILGILLDYFDE